ncbi:MAG: histone deacetylase [Acidimicrobiales bacterium]|jgi:acetoin utilization deacetylase AcuC-like enzyme
MVVLLGRHEEFAAHATGRWHPERAERLAAVLSGVADSPAAEVIVAFEPRRATRQELEIVHDPSYVERIEEHCLSGGGHLDEDTVAAPASFEAALRAAGAGLDAVERLRRGEADSAFLAVRPPGHHALGGRAMGFCLFNNVAVTAGALAAQGERVMVLDWDAHHGNGTQDIFYEQADVLYVSLHQFPFYPGTGSLSETGSGPGRGATVNLPFPAGTSGDTYRLAFDELVVPLAEEFAPSWLLISAGFDAHRADPLTDLGLSAGDFADLTLRVMRLVPHGRLVAFLEGGYDLRSLAACVGACVAALGGVDYRPEPASRDWITDANRQVIATAGRYHRAALSR